MIREYVNNHIELEEKKDILLSNDIKVIIAKRGAVNSIFVPSLTTKIIDKSQCQLVENPVTHEMELLLPAEFARLWLRELYFPYRASAKYKRYKQSVPNWYCGQFKNRELVYFDLVGAYYQLYRWLWLDFTDIGKKYNSARSLDKIADKLSMWKAARNSLVGTLASEQICQLSYDDYRYLPTKSDYYNPMLLYFLNSLLTELANIALLLGACYIATDCHIFEKSQKWAEFIGIMDRYNLKYRCVIGNGTIYRFAAYNISGQALVGEKSSVGTKTYERLSKYLDNPIYQNDPRAQKLLHTWNRPIRNVSKVQSYQCLEFYKSIA